LNVSSLNFTWAEENSRVYDVYMLTYGTPTGWQTNTAGSDITIISDSVNRRAERHVYGIQQNTPQQFNITIGSDSHKTRAEIDRIISWMIQPIPRDMIVNQPDMVFYKYNGFFTNPQTISAGRRPFGLQFTFVSTSPFAHTFPYKKTWDITHPKTIAFNNESGDSDYLFPTLSITPTNITQTFSIINNNDSNREFRFDFQAPFPSGSETIEINNSLQIIQSSMGNDFSRRRFIQFNKKWLRFVRGQNILQINGNGHMELSYVFARRIGA
jgi:hypothetical protein